MVPGFKELGGFVCQSALLALLFVLRPQRCRTNSLVLLVFRRPTCLEVRSK